MPYSQPTRLKCQVGITFQRDLILLKVEDALSQLMILKEHSVN